MNSAPSLVIQLQSDAIDSSVPIGDLLRKAKTAAVKLKRNDLAQWLEHEMTGYRDAAEVPHYRKLHAVVQFLNPVRGWCPIVGANHLTDYGAPVGEIAALLAAEGDTLVAPVPPKYVQAVSNQVGFDVDVRKLISKPSVAAILDAVRNVIHDWALKLEEAGIKGDGLTFSPNEAQRAQTVTVNIGFIGNATGIGAFGDHANIVATQSVSIGQLAQQALKLAQDVEKALPTAGLPKPVQAEVKRKLAELREEANASEPNEGQLRRGLAALQRVFEGAAGNVVAAGVVALIVKMLSG